MKKSRSSKGPENLRTRAEESLESEPDRPDNMCMEEANTLIHELRVHQIELEMQNEELRRVQNDLEISRSRYADLYDFAPVGYLTLNKNGEIIDLNLTAARQLGIERGHLLDKHFQYFVFQPDKKEFLTHLNAVFDKRERRVAEVRLSSRGGEQFYARLESIYVEEKDGTERCRTSVIDISYTKIAEEALQRAHDELEIIVEERTAELAEANELLRQEALERRRAEENLKINMEKLQRSSQELQDFAYSASHDMQEPLRKIRTFSQMVLDRNSRSLDDKGRDHLERVINSASRMSDMVRGLLSYSRVGTMREPFTPTDLTELVRESAAGMGRLIKQTGASIEIGELPRLDVDPSQIRVLFHHLIDNALKFRGESKPLIKIFAKSIDNPGQLGILNGKQYFDIFVEDNGIGFDVRYLDRIFTLFQRLHGRGAYEGTGMGLPVCRRIVEQHHGSITAKSAPGTGTTFIITLPSKQSDFYGELLPGSLS